MEGKHTPGPWYYQEESDAYTHIVRGPGGYFIHQGPQFTSGESKANARLIAAAPDLLEAVEAVVENSCGRCEDGICNYTQNPCEPIAKARAAIAKAKGKG